MVTDREDDIMQTLNPMQKKDRLDEIVEEASKLPIENQEYILATIRGMLFTKNHMLNQIAADRLSEKKGEENT